MPNHALLSKHVAVDSTQLLLVEQCFVMKLHYYYIQANRTAYAVYHSVHDNFYWVSHFGDPTFNHHLATGLVWIKLALILSTDPVLPFDPRDYAIAIKDIFENLKESSGDVLSGQGISLCKEKQGELHVTV